MVEVVRVRSVLNKHRRRDEWFLDDYSLNPYRGCSFNCVYCYIHGGRYGGRGLAVKVNAPDILVKELSRYARKGEYGFIAIGSATEPWMTGVEERYRVTRKCLHVISKYKFPVHCLTKSTLILRDLDLLETIRDNAVIPSDLRDRLRHGVLVTYSFSTLRDDIAGIFETGAPPPRDRLNALKRIIDEGFTAGIAYMPILPFISDSEIEDMVRIAKDLGCSYVFFAPLTLDGLGKQLYFRVIEKWFPELLGKYHILYNRRYSPPKWYASRLYRESMRYLEKYGLRLGIIDIDLRV